jgi:hypothetical protein
MTYSIFDCAGNLIDAFADRAAARDCLAGIAVAEPAAAAEFCLVVQDDAGAVVSAHAATEGNSA